MRRNRRNNAKKERIIMLASSAFVLTALTLTGIYMQNNNEEVKDDGYTLDFTALEDSADDKYQEIAENNNITLSSEENLEDDLDYMPLEAGSGNIEIPGLTKVSGAEGMLADEESFLYPRQPEPEEVTEEKEEEIVPQEEIQQEEPQEEETQETATAVSVENTEELSFAESEGLVRPIEGEVLIPFSMDSSVYFSTLDQYKYNPALMLVAAEGMNVSASAHGKVINIYEDAEIGSAVTMDLGSGYQITYGQLKDICVSLDSYVNVGETIGQVAAPTKYFSVEGANLYLKLTMDGTPVNPEALFQ